MELFRECRKEPKTHGARRSMWGEGGNDVRPYQVETTLAVWSARGNVIRPEFLMRLPVLALL
jgi:hypothetical protein